MVPQVRPWRADPQWVGFYDAWIARDAEGQPLHLDFPFVGGNASAQRLARGLPVAASCCWNGLAVLDPGPFQAGALRFRAADVDGRGEYVDSEISILCRDLRRLKGPAGLAVVIDPSVRVAYSHRGYKRANKVLATPRSPRVRAAQCPTARSEGPRLMRAFVRPMGARRTSRRDC